MIAGLQTAPLARPPTLFDLIPIGGESGGNGGSPADPPVVPGEDEGTSPTIGSHGLCGAGVGLVMMLAIATTGPSMRHRRR